jgi:hypothetical protein
MMSVPSVCKTSDRYHGIFLNTETGSGRTTLVDDTAEPLIVCLIKDCEVILVPRYRGNICNVWRGAIASYTLNCFFFNSIGYKYVK